MDLFKKLKAGAKVSILISASLLSHFSSAQVAPTAADLIDNNLAFLKLDRKNVKLGDDLAMIFIAPLTVGGVNNVYYIKGYTNDPLKPVSTTNPVHLGVGLATTTNGITFNDQGQVLKGELTGVDAGYASFPGVWYENGTYYLVYEAAGTDGRYNGDIGLATSADGKKFTKQGIILWHNTSGWESVNIGTPSLYKENGIWYLHYHGYDGNTCQIGVASGADLMHLVKYAGNPIIKSIPGTAQAGTAGRRGISKVGGKYYMTYEVSEAKAANAGSFGGVKWSSGMASSADLFNWTLYSQNPVLPQTVPSDQMGNDGPTFMSAGGLNYIYYRVTQPGNHSLRALIANESVGGFDTSWTMSTANIGHLVGRAEGDGWAANMTQDALPGFLQYGPYYAGLEPGDHIATWSFMIDNNTSDDTQQLRLEVVDADNNGAVINSRAITRKQWKQAGRYEYFSVPFRLDPALKGHRLEFRAYWHRGAYIRQGKVGLS